jgi:hypothetical protein
VHASSCVVRDGKVFQTQTQGIDARTLSAYTPQWQTALRPTDRPTDRAGDLANRAHPDDIPVALLVSDPAPSDPPVRLADAPAPSLPRFRNVVSAVGPFVRRWGRAGASVEVPTFHEESHAKEWAPRASGFECGLACLAWLCGAGERTA